MDKNNFNKFINNYEIHCDKIFPMREDPFKKHEEVVNVETLKSSGDLKTLNKQKDRITESNPSIKHLYNPTVKADVSINNDDKKYSLDIKKSIVKERQEMMVKNKDFLLSL